jgi:hypothetical protein
MTAGLSVLKGKCEKSLPRAILAHGEEMTVIVPGRSKEDLVGRALQEEPLAIFGRKHIQGSLSVAHLQETK